MAMMVVGEAGLKDGRVKVMKSERRREEVAGQENDS